MKKNILLLFFVFVYSQETISQNTFFIGNKTYPSTETYWLHSMGNPLGIEILFVKDQDKGMIVVTNKGLGDGRVQGNLIIYLEDNTTMTCVDRKIYDKVNYKSTTVYYLTAPRSAKCPHFAR